ncbi:MAG: hypothetical protein R3E31_25905 [Chloroflexota bacterium]
MKAQTDFAFIRRIAWVAFFMFITSVLPVIMELIVPRALRTVIDQGINIPGDMTIIWRGSAIMLTTALIGAVATLGKVTAVPSFRKGWPTIYATNCSRTSKPSPLPISIRCKRGS